MKNATCIVDSKGGERARLVYSNICFHFDLICCPIVLNVLSGRTNLSDDKQHSIPWSLHGRTLKGGSFTQFGPIYRFLYAKKSNLIPYYLRFTPRLTTDFGRLKRSRKTIKKRAKNQTKNTNTHSVPTNWLGKNSNYMPLTCNIGLNISCGHPALSEIPIYMYVYGAVIRWTCSWNVGTTTTKSVGAWEDDVRGFMLWLLHIIRTRRSTYTYWW